jgi:enoyl-CoA hydratase
VREAAEALARQLADFPQRCLRADRLSAMRQWDEVFPVAIRQEFEGGLAALQTEGLAGALRFAKGAGRHGRFE